MNKVNKNLTRESIKKLALIEKPIIGTIINSVSKEGTKQSEINIILMEIPIIIIRINICQ